MVWRELLWHAGFYCPYGFLFDFLAQLVNLIGFGQLWLSGQGSRSEIIPLLSWPGLEMGTAVGQGSWGFWLQGLWKHQGCTKVQLAELPCLQFCCLLACLDFTDKEQSFKKSPVFPMLPPSPKFQENKRIKFWRTNSFIAIGYFQIHFYTFDILSNKIVLSCSYGWCLF